MAAESADQQVASLDWGPEFRAHLTARRPLVFRHTLAGHHALDREAIAQLAESLGDASVICEAAVKPLVFAEGAPEPGRAKQAAEVVRRLDENESWMTLLNIEQHPRYRALIDEQLDRAARLHGIDPSSLRRRMGFIFASSPHSVTGAHFDIEHSLLLQLRGNRTLSFGAFADQATREREVSRYWNGSYGKLTTMPIPVSDVAVGPGDGVYIPPYRPHWLLNGDATSLSLTITFFTRENEAESLVQAFNERLRKLGLHPRHEGESPLRDSAKVGFMRTYSAARRRLRPTKPAPR
jgi:ribosomal protein L16 Arg81 hydroxylase